MLLLKNNKNQCIKQVKMVIIKYNEKECNKYRKSKRKFDWVYK